MLDARVKLPFLKPSTHQQSPVLNDSHPFLDNAFGNVSVAMTVCRPSGPIKNIHPVVTPVTCNIFCKTDVKRGDISVPSFKISAISFKTRKLDFSFNSALLI